MPYLRPPRILRRVVNPLAMRLGFGGVVTLAVARRRSGTVQRVPLLPAEHEGARYLVSARGDTDWARNLRAAGEAELSAPRRAPERIHVVEVPAAERGPIVASYRRVAGRSVKSLFERLPDPADHPVFRIR